MTAAICRSSRRSPRSDSGTRSCRTQVSPNVGLAWTGGELSLARNRGGLTSVRPLLFLPPAGRGKIDAGCRQPLPHVNSHRFSLIKSCLVIKEMPSSSYCFKSSAHFSSSRKTMASVMIVTAYPLFKAPRAVLCTQPAASRPTR